MARGPETGRELRPDDVRPHCNRFQKYVRWGATMEECAIWTGGRRTADGYGCFFVSGDARVQAHRVSLALSGVTIPAGAVVRHACDVKLCVNPRHLSLGTQLDNGRDKAERGRARGIPNNRHCAKLTQQDVNNIRVERTFGMSLSTLAKKYGVSEGAISMAARGITWR